MIFFVYIIWVVDFKFIYVDFEMDEKEESNGTNGFWSRKCRWGEGEDVSVLVKGIFWGCFSVKRGRNGIVFFYWYCVFWGGFRCGVWGCKNFSFFETET